MARKEIPGIHVPCDQGAYNNRGRENRRGKRIWDIEGVGAPAPRDEFSAGRGKKSNSLLEAMLGASGVVGTDPNLLEIQRQEAQQRAQKKAQRKQNKRTFKQEKEAAKNKTARGLFVAGLGAATGNPTMTTAGVGTTVDGMVDTIKAKQNRRARKKDPYYDPNNEEQRSSRSSGFVKSVIDLFKKVADFGQKKASTSPNQKPSPEPTTSGGFDMSDSNENIIEGEFTVIEPAKPKQLTSGKKS